jgi:hypothetical protein
MKGCGVVQARVERTTTTTIATTTWRIYVDTTSNNSGLKDFNGTLMC